VSAITRRRPLRTLCLRAIPVIILAVLAGTLTAAVQLRHIRVVGPSHFSARDVVDVLRPALGRPTLAVRAEELRQRVRGLPWVGDAVVAVSLDGLITCTVAERTPVALLTDTIPLQLVDIEGRVLGSGVDHDHLLELRGFARHPEQLAEVLAARVEFEQRWGAALTSVTRLGPHDLVLQFAGSPQLLVDPRKPQNLTSLRQVLAAWLATNRAAPERLDARVDGRVTVLPAPEPVEDDA
jgi:cell division septal protein FtsQ